MATLVLLTKKNAERVVIDGDADPGSYPEGQCETVRGMIEDGWTLVDALRIDEDVVNFPTDRALKDEAY